ncbi:MAG: Re/Si-specific NAD(P)(+) transhydrogenase subunit alpha [Planctomycetaceae bacterium]|nr:Re/Si-specific NAD(P)(+) transhydrogenase subunit alpha [Planctomycetaceae bacterium]
MIVAVPRENFPGERRVAMVPATVPALVKAGLEVLIEVGAGLAAGYSDQQYMDKGAKLAASRDEVFSSADVLLQVRAAGANPVAGQADLARYRKGQVVIAMCDPLGSPKAAAELGAKGVSLFALELLPRITRAQSMDVLSSQATIAGYRAVLLASVALPKLFPMLMTAAGTLTAAKVLIVGAGVAGLQAIATARRLGAAVSAYDVRPAVKEQVQSLGAKFVEMSLDASTSETKGGYAQEMGEEFYRKQRELMTRVVSDSDVVITTAAVPGKKSPVLVTAEMVAAMAPGSVIVDLAAERGGNCELTKPDQTTVEHGVTILGPTNLSSEAPYHASQMYAKNIATFLLNLVKEKQVHVNLDDEIIRDTLIARDGQVVHARIQPLLQ